MPFIKFLKILVVVTSIALVYIHLRMQIIDLAYQGKAKEQVIGKLTEDNGQITYKILALKSVNHLGVKMLAENSGMQFADPQNVLEIATSDEFLPENLASKNQNIPTRNHSLLSFLSPSAQAEAKGQE